MHYFLLMRAIKEKCFVVSTPVDFIFYKSLKSERQIYTKNTHEIKVDPTLRVPERPPPIGSGSIERSDKKMVLEVNDKKDLSVKIQEAGNKLVVIDFYAIWCLPCKSIAPKIEELEKQYPNVVFLKVDVDENEEIAADYDISAMPTFVFIKNGNKLDSFSGANFSKLQSTIDQYL